MLKLNLAKVMSFCSLLKPPRKACLQSSVILKAQRPASSLCVLLAFICRFSPQILLLFHCNILLNNGDAVPIPRSGRSLGEGHGNPLRDSCRENPMDREGWQSGSN